MPKMSIDEKVAWYKREMTAIGFVLRKNPKVGLFHWVHARTGKPLPTYYDIPGNHWTERFVNAARRAVRSF